MIQFSKNAENIRGRHKLFQVRRVYLRLPGAPFVVEHKDKRGRGGIKAKTMDASSENEGRK